jgi:hypothetical protein
VSDQLLLLGVGAALGLFAGLLTIVIGGRQLESRAWVLAGAVAAGLTMALFVLVLGALVDLGLNDVGTD